MPEEKICPFNGGKCGKDGCEMFMKFFSIDEQTKEKVEFGNCVFVQMPLLLIELNRNVLATKNNKGG